MSEKPIYLCSFVLVLGLAGSASAAVLYSDSFNRPDSYNVGINDNALGGVISANWGEVEGDQTQHQIRGNALLMIAGAGNSYIDHKFTGAELLTSFTIEFDVMPSALITGAWFAIEFAPGPESFTTSIDLTQSRVTFALLMRPQSNFVVWDNGTNLGTNSSNVIDNSSNPVPVKLQIDSPDGYSDGNTATIRLWINDILVENFAGGSSYDFMWQGHTDGLYISFENNNVLDKSVDNLVISSPFSPTQAFDPSPANEATDVPRYVVLSWSPGESANTHDVYFGTVLDDVNNATVTVDPAGVYQGRQDLGIYSVGERLDFGQTYYWRIDEVNAAPDYTIFKGDLWSFTVEPYAYPIENITPTASSVNRADEGPENTVNGSGLNDDDLHSSENTAMWLSSGIDPNATWIQYEFDRVHKLYQMWVWNYNTSVEPLIGFGIKEAAIEYSADGTNWATLGTTHEFARGTGAAGYAANTTVDLGGAAAKYVKITADSNWGGMVNQYGLSEVRFLYIPVLAGEPNPASGATGVSVDATLRWRAGREAAKHNVYLSTDEQAVVDGTAPVATVTEAGYAPSLDLASTCYWRIDEVNNAETPPIWEGDIWSFSTQEYLVVDDFESYNDIPVGEEGSNLIYETWVDGFGTTTNGSTMGYTEAFQPSMEKTRIFDGSQSAPLFYNNTTASLSEVTANVANLQAGHDWTRHGIKALTLRFFGDPNNNVQQMYVKINGSKVTYDGDAENIRLKGWQMWYIDLASLGVNLSNVTTLTIGFERIGTLGGQGMVLLDGIRLYAYDRQLITPVDPGTAGLQAQYQFEGNANDSSGKGRNGSLQGGPVFAAGKVGQAISLDGIDDYVNIDGYKGVLADAAGMQQPFTATAWVKSTSTGDATIVCWGASTNGQRVDFRLGGGRLRVEHGNGNLQGNTVLADDQWHHVALTVAENGSISYPAVKLYLDGNDDSQTTTDPDTFNIVASVDVNIGRRGTNNDRVFPGSLDDVRIYDRVLTQEEIASLAGKTKPFDKPF